MNARRRGFTVLELLVALAIMAMIAAALANTAGLGSRAWQRASAYPEADARILLRSNLRHWLETAKPPARLIGQRQEFTGTPERMTFLTAAQVPGGPVGTEARISLALIDSAGAGPTLTLTIDRIDAEGGLAATESRELVAGVEEGSLRYFRSDADTGRGAWTDRWPDPNRLPDLVAVEIEAPGTPWPPLIVSPKLD